MCKNRRQCARPNSQFRLRCTWSQCLLSIYFCTLTVRWVFKLYTFCVIGAAFFIILLRFLFFVSFFLFILLQFLITRCCGALNSISLHTLRTLLTLHTENIVNKARKRTHAYASWHKSCSLYALYTWHSFTLFGWHSTAYLWFISIPFNFAAFVQVHAACTLYKCTCACVFVCDSKHMTIPLIYFCTWLKYNIFRFNGFHYLPLKPWNLSCAPKE